MFKFNGLIPELSVSKISKSVEFYTDILLFKLEYERKDDKFALLSLGESQIMLEEINGNWETGELEYPFGRGINFMIYVDNVDGIYNSLKSHGYPIKVEIEENWYKVNDKLKGNKEFLIIDLDGYLLRFAQSLGEKDYVSK